MRLNDTSLVGAGRDIRYAPARTGHPTSGGRRTVRRRQATALAALAACGAALGLGAPPASAVPGLEMVRSAQSVTNSSSPKTATAWCPPGKRVIGGGGWVQEIGDITRKPTLTRLQPIQLYDGSRDAYVATGAETTPGTGSSWWVQAYAVCANPLPGLHLVSDSTVPSSSLQQMRAAVCPAGERVLGTGARASTTAGEVVLQVARPSGPGDIARAQAHEDANGYTGSWSLTSYAICAPTPPGYEVVFAPSDGDDSESTKIALATCPVGKRLHSAGAAITNVAPGYVSLQGIFPWLDGGQTQALAVENTPTSVDWDFIVATATCAF